ncbi:MAG: 2TM domain-containing protein [Pseudomonadota bacterium]
MSKDQSYADEEVRAIIERALKEQPASGVSHEDLLSIGAGVGLSRAQVESAAREVTEARLTTTATNRIVSRRRRGLAAHAFVYVAVNALLFAINFLTTPGEWWVLFPVFAWGLGLLMHAGFALSSQVSERRLTREKRRLLQAAGAGVAAIVERRAGVRVAGPVDQIEEPDSGDSEAARSQRGARGQ